MHYNLCAASSQKLAALIYRQLILVYCDLNQSFKVIVSLFGLVKFGLFGSAVQCAIQLEHLLGVLAHLVLLPKVDLVSGLLLPALEGAAELGGIHFVFETVVGVAALPQLGADPVFQVLIQKFLLADAKVTISVIFTQLFVKVRVLIILKVASF